MFGKVLKYDFRAIAKMFLILALSSLGAAVFGGLCIRISVDLLADTKYIFLGIVTMLLAIFSIIAFVAALLVVLILLFVNFYKKFFSDEAYLTFTLPVSRKTLLFSKTLNAFIWTLLVTLTLFGGILIIVSIAAGEDGIGLNIFDSFFESLGAWTFVYAIEIILALLTFVAFSVVLVVFSITVGASVAKRARLIIGIAIWYGSNTILSLVMQCFGTFGSLIVANTLTQMGIDKMPGVQNSIIALIVLIAIFIISSITYVLYCITLSLLERRLNLV